MTWDFNDGTTHVTGTTTFNVDKDGRGTLAYTASNGNELYGTVAPGSYQKLPDGSAIFSGTITAGSCRLPREPDRQELRSPPRSSTVAHPRTAAAT